MATLLLLLALLAPDPADQVAKLRQEVDVLKQTVAEAATQRGLAELEARLERVRADLNHLLALRTNDEDLRRTVESLSLQIGELERRVSSLRLRGEDEARGLTGIAAAFDEGFTLRSPDNAFVLAIHMLLQFRYEGLQVDDRQETAATFDRSSLLLPRARLDLRGNAYVPTLTYRFLADFARDPILQEAWVEWAPRPDLAMRAGRIQTPYARQWLNREDRFQLVERAEATELFRADRDLGVQLSFTPAGGRVQAIAALLNGSALPAQVNDNVDFLYALRLVLQPLGPVPPDEGDAEDTPNPLAALGFSLLYNLVPTDAALVGRPVDVDGDSRPDNVGVLLAGADLAARWRGASLQAELFYRRRDFGAAPATDRTSAWGAYAQAGYYLLPRLAELAARYSWAQPSAFGLADSARRLVGSTHQEATFGGSYLIAGRELRAQLEYSYLIDEKVPELGGAASRYSHRFRAQLQLAF